MGFRTLKDQLASKLVGVGQDRIAIRTQGCWSCVHWDMDKAVDLWWKEARQNTLNRGVQIALESPHGEADPRVRAIREMVPATDAGMTQGQWGACKVGRMPNGDPVGSNVHQTYLCGVWTGREGASVAREGAKADTLPEELMERLDDGTLKV